MTEENIHWILLIVQQSSFSIISSSKVGTWSLIPQKISLALHQSKYPQNHKLFYDTLKTLSVSGSDLILGFFYLYLLLLLSWRSLDLWEKRIRIWQWCILRSFTLITWLVQVPWGLIVGYFSIKVVKHDTRSIHILANVTVMVIEWPYISTGI